MSVKIPLGSVIERIAEFTGTNSGRVITFLANALPYTKIVGLVLLVCSAISMSIRGYSYLMNQFGIFKTSFEQGLGAMEAYGYSGPADFLAILNVVLPINEAFALFAAYLGVIASLLTLKGIMKGYQLVPLKAS